MNVHGFSSFCDEKILSRRKSKMHGNQLSCNTGLDDKMTYTDQNIFDEFKYQLRHFQNQLANTQEQLSNFQAQLQEQQQNSQSRKMQDIFIFIVLVLMIVFCFMVILDFQASFCKLGQMIPEQDKQIKMMHQSLL